MKFFRSTLYTVAGNILTGIISLFLAVYLSRNLGPTGKGVLTTILVVANLVALILDSGISIANVFFCRFKNISKKILFSNSMLWSLVMGALGSFAAYVFSIAVTDYDHSLILYGVFLIPFYLFLNLQRQLLLACEKVVFFNLSNVLQQLSILILVILFFTVGACDPQHAVTAYMVSLILICMLVSWMCQVKSIQIDSKILFDGLRFGFLGHLGTLMQQCNFRIDVIILGMFSGSGAVGIYSVSYTCAEVLLRFPRAIGMIIYPKVSGMKKDESDLFTIQVFKLTNIVLLVLGFVIGIAGFFLIPVLFGRKFSFSVYPFLVLLPGILFFSWNNIFIEYLKGIGFPKSKLYTAGLALIVIVLLDILLIPKFSIMGASLASSVGYMASGILSLYLFCHKTGNSVRSVVRIDVSDVSHVINILRVKLLRR